MKSFSMLFLLLSLGGVQSFATRSRSQRTTTAINMGGFMEGKVPKNDIMKKEDEAMWIDDGSSDSNSGGWNPFAIAKSFDSPKKKASKPAVAAKKAPPPPPKKKASGFKMPWDK